MNRTVIIKEANKRIKEQVENFNDLSSGEKETIQDKFIEIICQEKGFSISDFYASNGKQLNEKILFS
jgi:hypothetical protein